MATKLTIKQQRVCNFYLAGNSMRKSLILAGYSESYADHHSLKFLKNKKVMDYIRDRQRQEAEAALADAVFVRDRLKKLCNDKDADVALTALKQLDAHNKWIKELDGKLKELEEKQNTPDVNININYDGYEHD